MTQNLKLVHLDDNCMYIISYGFALMTPIHEIGRTNQGRIKSGVLFLLTVRAGS